MKPRTSWWRTSTRDWRRGIRSARWTVVVFVLAGCTTVGPDWNILNYGRIENNIRDQDARLQQLLENYQGRVLDAVREVEDGMVAFLRSREQERILAETETAARRSLAIANVGYREGISDFQRVLDAQGSLLRAQQSYVSARSTTVSSAVGIYRALGGGWEIRAGRGFVDEATRDTMQQRVDWGDLLQPKATEPPLKGQVSVLVYTDDHPILDALGRALNWLTSILSYAY